MSNNGTYTPHVNPAFNAPEEDRPHAVPEASERTFILVRASRAIGSARRMKANDPTTAARYTTATYFFGEAPAAFLRARCAARLLRAAACTACFGLHDA